MNNNCQTKEMTSHYSICLTGVCDCPFVITFGNGRICTHPEHESFGLIMATAQQAQKRISSYV
ncbi:MAG: hypothetical protein PHY09_16970 [Desulfuromonadaceae bacterium]|nr:hypothetical protein [Desulfuromonadaceae bacterium]MDD5106448.1 hypothetical protein [Desulfuromonadaceae bacterium]